MKKLIFIVLLCFMGHSSIYAQTTKIVKGAVIDKDGNPLPGASVEATNGAETTIVDADGTFVLEVPVWLNSVTAKYAGMRTQKQKLSDKDLLFKLKKERKGLWMGYVQPTFQIGQSMAVGGSVGCYLQNINIEGYYNMGLGKSEEIWWARQNEILQCTYSMMSYGGRLGYGFVAGTRFRFTPQVGAGCVSVSSKEYNSGGTATIFSLGTRCEFALTRWLGVSLTPEYSIPVSKKDDLEQLTDVSGKIGGWCKGFNCRFGIAVNF